MNLESHKHSIEHRVTGMDNEMHVYSQWVGPQTYNDVSALDQIRQTSSSNLKAANTVAADLQNSGRVSTLRISQSVSSLLFTRLVQIHHFWESNSTRFKIGWLWLNSFRFFSESVWGSTWFTKIQWFKKQSRFNSRFFSFYQFEALILSDSIHRNSDSIVWILNVIGLKTIQ